MTAYDRDSMSFVPKYLWLEEDLISIVREREIEDIDNIEEIDNDNIED